MKYITGNSTIRTSASLRLVVRRVVLHTTTGQTFTHRTLYPVSQGAQVLPEGPRNLAVAIQDALRIYFGYCTPMSTYIRCNPLSSSEMNMNIKIASGIVGVAPLITQVYLGTATSSEGNWAASFQFNAFSSPTPGPFDYTAPCMTGQLPPKTR